MKALQAFAAAWLVASIACHAAADPIAARAVPVRLAAPAVDDFADLAPFGRAVESARVVALDEQTHGGHEEFVLKLRLLRYLHERLGFDVLVLESGFFDVGLIEQARRDGARVDDLGPGNIFFMYSKSAEGRALLQYLDATRGTAHPITLAGMDSQHTGALGQAQLMSRLQVFLGVHTPARGAPTHPDWSEADWSAFDATTAALLALRPGPPSAQARAGFDRVCAALLRRFAAIADPVPSIGSARWWTRVIVDLQAQAQQLWTAPRGNARDLAMGDNVAWIADQLVPGQRIAVWGHAIHLVHDAPEPAAPPLAGTVMRRHFGAAYHVAHLTGLEGRYLDYETLRPQDIPAAAPDGLEARLATRPGAALYLGPPAGPVPDAPAARYMDYLPFGSLPGRGLHWESTFFIRRITPVKMVR